MKQIATRSVMWYRQLVLLLSMTADKMNRLSRSVSVPQGQMLEFFNAIKPRKVLVITIYLFAIIIFVFRFFGLQNDI